MAVSTSNKHTKMSNITRAGVAIKMQKMKHPSLSSCLSEERLWTSVKLHPASHAFCFATPTTKWHCSECPLPETLLSEPHYDNEHFSYIQL